MACFIIKNLFFILSYSIIIFNLQNILIIPFCLSVPLVSSCKSTSLYVVSDIKKPLKTPVFSRVLAILVLYYFFVNTGRYLRRQETTSIPLRFISGISCLPMNHTVYKKALECEHSGLFVYGILHR